MTPLPRSTPSDQGVDPAAIEAFLDAVEAHDDIEMHSLMVVKGGHVVAEGWWAPYSPERVHLLYSLSKSFTSTAAAFAQQEGLLDLDDRLVDHFPEIDADVLDPRSRAIRLRHVASMASGHTHDMVNEAFERDPDEPVRGFLLNPPDREPGSVFAYNQPCTYSLGAVVRRRAGTTLSESLRPRLFDPLGIDHVGWAAYPRGRQLGFTGLHARTEDIAKLGLLHLRRGRWGKDQLITEEWVAEATTKREPLSLLMTDIDHFKTFNDNYGHQTGDQVLRLVAMAVKNNTKGQDIAARYGGEEFAVVLPNTVMRSAATVADHIRRAVMTKQLMKRSTHEQLGRITISIGVATLRDGDTAQSLIGRADACLYAAKRNGRNRVICEADAESGLESKVA